jgi:hypothetical protein
MFEWMNENLQTVFTAIGLIYAAARTIVTLTPTPKDDKVVETVGGWLKTLAKVFGLDLKQGIHKSDG